MLPQCQLAPKNNKQIISKINIAFAGLLDKYNIAYEIEYNNHGKIVGYFYDFYLSEYNLLIEINPTFSHSVIPNQLGWCVDKDYHYDKVKLANDNSYNCICIWDWDNKEDIIKAIKNNTLKIEKTDIIKYWNIPESKMYVEDNNFNEQIMLDKGYKLVYTDGQKLIY